MCRIVEDLFCEKHHHLLYITKNNEKLCDKCLEEIYNTNFNMLDNDEILEIEATV